MTSQKIASHLSISLRKATIALAIIRGQLDPLNYPGHFPATEKWARSCYNPLPAKDTKLAALSELLGMHGVECIQGDWWDHYYGDNVAEYLNTGDSYAATILLDHQRGKWLLTSWGDFVETMETETAYTQD